MFDDGDVALSVRLWNCSRNPCASHLWLSGVCLHRHPSAVPPHAHRSKRCTQSSQLHVHGNHGHEYNPIHSRVRRH